MIYNYHTHTPKCGHAYGEEENYIKISIANGIKKLGFSDHIPFKHDDGKEMNFRIKEHLVSDYFKLLKSLKEKYKDQIEIYIGFEKEYFPNYFDKMVSDAINAGAQYLILGQHSLNTDRNDGYDNLPYVDSRCFTEDNQILSNYVDSIIAAAKTGYISYVAHPDCIKFFGDSSVSNKDFERMLIALKELNVPVEINLLGIRTNRNYPRKDFWQIAGKVGTPVVIGMDAHQEIDAFDGKSLETAKEMIKEFNLNFISDYKPKLINK